MHVDRNASVSIVAFHLQNRTPLHRVGTLVLLAKGKIHTLTYPSHSLLASLEGKPSIMSHQRPDIRSPFAHHNACPAYMKLKRYLRPQLSCRIAINSCTSTGVMVVIVRYIPNSGRAVWMQHAQLPHTFGSML